MSWIGGDLNQVERIRQAVYDRWEWNYGSSPRCQIDKRRRVEGCGEIRVCLDLKEGAIQALSFYGDFFSRKEPDQLAQRLIGCPLREEAPAGGGAGGGNRAIFSEHGPG